MTIAPGEQLAELDLWNLEFHLTQKSDIVGWTVDPIVLFDSEKASDTVGWPVDPGVLLDSGKACDTVGFPQSPDSPDCQQDSLQD